MNLSLQNQLEQMTLAGGFFLPVWYRENSASTGKGF